MSAADHQAALFVVETAPAAQVSGAPTGRYDPAAYDAALTGDGYRWLADLLPAPHPLICEGCGQPMALPVAAPVLWACPACHAGEAA